MSYAIASMKCAVLVRLSPHPGPSAKWGSFMSESEQSSIKGIFPDVGQCSFAAQD